MKRFSRVEIVDDIVRLPNNFIRGIKDVPVRLHALESTLTRSIKFVALHQQWQNQSSNPDPGCKPCTIC